MVNLLVNENSPYLLQHKDNPVEWYPWGSRALEKAREEDKPIFLSIGYAACHWCHVMEKESFEDPVTASLMNAYFVNIKVDREERPDLDSLYMSAVVAMTGSGGWPMSIFLTPEGKPFFGGTYFPPVQRFNLPSFRDILQSVAKAWELQREQILESSQNITIHLQNAIDIAENTNKKLSPDTLQTAVNRLIQSYDWNNGGWGNAPKFPQPMSVEVLLNQAVKENDSAQKVVWHCLTAMAKGGMYDVVGGGFARYSTDEKWLVPHFEKMLYDNALLSRAYLHGFLVCRDPHFRHVCEETLAFLTREMLDPSGGFYSSLDADSQGEEGKFYTWTTEQILSVLDNPDEYDFFTSAYNLSEKGNFENKTILQRIRTDQELAALDGIEESDVYEKLHEYHQRMLESRNSRIRPATDDKIICSWNALTLISFSEAARYLHNQEYLNIAIQNAKFLINELYSDDRLLRSWRHKQAQLNGYLEDYAALVLGLLSLYQSNNDSFWFSKAYQLTKDMINNFYDPEVGFFDTRADHESLFMRPRDLQDNATPSGNSLAATALLNMAAYTGHGDWRQIAEKSLLSIQSLAGQYPPAFAFWLSALDFAATPIQEIAILTNTDEPKAEAFQEVLWAKYRPFTITAISSYPPPVDSPPLLENRLLVNGQTSVYICQDFICKYPIHDPSALAGELLYK